MAPVASSRSPSVRSKSQPQGANSKLVSSCGSCKGRSSGRRRGKTSGVGTQGLEQDDDAEEEGCQTASEQTGALDEAPCDLPQPRLPIEELPVDVLHRLVHMLPLQSSAQLAQTCKRLACMARTDEASWRALCHRDFAGKTDVELWLQDSAADRDASLPGISTCSTPSRKWSGGFSNAAYASPLSASCYRDLYQILHHNQRVVGTWRGLGYGSKGALFHFRWRPSCIEGVRVACGPGADEAHLEPFYTFDGRFGGAVTSFLDEGMCTVEVVPGGIRQECSPLPSCSRAEAAAIVAGGSGVFGTSPEGSFGHEFMLFMQGKVAPGRRKKKSPGWQLREAPPIIHHLSHLPVARSTSTHPLGGLWQGIIGEEGLQVISIDYCFRRSLAMIVATKVTGDDCVSSGSFLFEAEASAIPEPWSQPDLQLILNANHVHGEDVMGQQEAVQDILSIHAGRAAGAQFGGGKGNVQGRLWQYENGGLGFCWILADDWQLAEFTRLDSVLSLDVASWRSAVVS